MQVTKALALAVCLATVTGPLRAEPPVSGPFRIGATGIMCVKEPCPRIGVVRLGSGGGKRGWPIYSGKSPPRVEGDVEVRAAVAEHWTIDGCLIVEGAYRGGGVLEVRRIVEDCRRR